MIIYGMTHALYGVLAGPMVSVFFNQNLEFENQLNKIAQSIPEFFWWLENFTWNSEYSILVILPAFILFITLLRSLSQFFQFYLTGILSQKGLFSLRNELGQYLLHLPLEHIQNFEQGDVLNRFTSDAKLIEQSIFNGVGSLFKDSLSIIILVILIFILDPFLALVLFVLGPLLAFPIYWFSKKIKSSAKIYQQVEGRYASRILETIKGIPFIQSMGLGTYQEEKLNKENLHYHNEFLQNYKLRAARSPIIEVLGVVFIFLFIGFAMTQNRKPEHLISFIVLLTQLYDPIKKIGRVSDFLSSGTAAYERIKEFFNQDLIFHKGIKTQIEKKTESEITKNTTISSIQFDQLCFSYADAQPLFKNVNFSMRTPGLYWFQGESGKGKSTLIKLLLGIIKPEQGKIKINGQDIRLQQNNKNEIAWVQQNPFFFTGSLRENLCMDNNNLSEPQLNAALKMVNLKQWVQSLPQGLNTSMGEVGEKLSGGQKQRLDIARAILRKPSLFIFDESTSHLDRENADIIEELIQELSLKYLCVMVSHQSEIQVPKEKILFL